MAISVFSLFSIGVGPSSSHTVGPMRAARQFLLNCQEKQVFSSIYSIVVHLYGSLALTGKGHATDMAILLGLQGETPDGVHPADIAHKMRHIRDNKSLNLLGTHPIHFEEDAGLLFHNDTFLPFHSNGMRFTVFNSSHKELFTQVFYSVGGGFVVNHESTLKSSKTAPSTTLSSSPTAPQLPSVPYPFKCGDDILHHCEKHGITIQELMMANEKTWHTEKEIKQKLLNIWSVMQSCVKRGCEEEGILPGGLNVKRRAPRMSRDLMERERLKQSDPAEVLDWVSLWALAVNEENAAGGRVVTAPTNGASGIIPSVLHYYAKFAPEPTDEGIVTFLLVAGAIGFLYKEGASLSAAEMGCQGEVGVACSMAAGGLTAALGGTAEQVENAAEIGMEHNLGLTCDPIKGLVQIPCIERNTMGAIKAINASRLAFKGDGSQKVSLDEVIATMKQIGHDMNVIYKETSLGGLAVNVAEC